MFYHRVLPDLIVGSCPQSPEDVDWLVEYENVGAIFSLQQDCDMEYFGQSVAPIAARCVERGDVKHVRSPIQDFSPYDLRLQLPRAASLLYATMRDVSPLADSTDTSLVCGPEDQGIIRRLTYVPPVPEDFAPAAGGAAPARAAPATDVPPPTGASKPPCVYVHCTAGMGRAPGTALAYMNWVRGFQLDDAFAVLRGVRACCPKLSAIRAAAVDVLTGCPRVPVTLGFRRAGPGARIAGLDFGWGVQKELAYAPARQRWEITRELPTGDFSYKLVLPDPDGGDDAWCCSADHPRVQDGENWNNTLQVRAAGAPPGRRRDPAGTPPVRPSQRHPPHPPPRPPAGARPDRPGGGRHAEPDPHGGRGHDPRRAGEAQEAHHLGRLPGGVRVGVRGARRLRAWGDAGARRDPGRDARRDSLGRRPVRAECRALFRPA